MKKINLMRIYILLTIFLGLGAVWVSAQTTLNFVGVNIGSIDQKFSDVVFRANGNDFMGSFFWLNAKSLDSGEVISFSGSSPEKTCFKQVRGLYYNSQRGNRVRPLDSATRDYLSFSNPSYNNLTISGGLYTSCSGDEYSVYGQVSYHVSGDSYNSYLVAGTKYNRGTNTISGEFAKSFQRFDNKFPIGYIYDSHGGGIGFVGSFPGGGSTQAGSANNHSNLITSLNNGSGINNIFGYGGTNNSEINGGGITISTTAGNALNTLLNVGIQGTIGLSFSVNTVEKNTLLGNFDRKTLMFNTLNVNFSKLINQVRQNSENMCRGKYKDVGFITTFADDNLFCIDFNLSSAKKIVLNSTDIFNLRNKILITKNGDIQIDKTMSSTDGPTSIFIDNGNLILNQNMGGISMDGNGYPSISNAVTSGAYLKGNFIVNGLIYALSGSTKSDFGHKLFINGKLASLNTPSIPSEGRKAQVKDVLNTGADTYNNFIRLDRVFTRQCDPINGIGDDNVNCSHSGDNNALLPLVIIDGYYPNNLIK
ncbi:hypothetical protein K9M48_03800 [Candidatus Gracilibacteria bacterium]|nr:hypothetical protein [Candidatus Gracilibacteria bacterium]